MAPLEWAGTVTQAMSKVIQARAAEKARGDGGGGAGPEEPSKRPRCDDESEVQAEATPAQAKKNSLRTDMEALEAQLQSKRTAEPVEDASMEKEQAPTAEAPTARGRRSDKDDEDADPSRSRRRSRSKGRQADEEDAADADADVASK